MKMPLIVTLKGLLTSKNKMEVDGKWIPARQYPLYTLGNRLKATWMVFTGKADALVWPDGIVND